MAVRDEQLYLHSYLIIIMDILTHTISGLAAGTVVAGVSKKSTPKQLGIIAISGFGGAFPDIDALSLWSKFDVTIGRFFHLSHPGDMIYSGKFWYSHHGFFHSLFAALMIAAVIWTLGYLLHARFRKLNFKDFIKSGGAQKLLLIGFIAGYMMHLLGDIPTPASTWEGIRLFWPFKAYIGGTGQIWWWNNYDIFLITCGVFAVNTAFLFIERFLRSNLNKIIAGVFAAGFVLSFIQINTRNHDFAYSGHTTRYQELEAASKEQQKEILGDRLYNVMEKFDKNLPVHF